jgi:outer membrane biosynthesis protein TonB
MRRHRTLSTAVALSLGLALSGCESFDLDSMFNAKKPLPGDRRPVFPEGVPGVPQGVPPELVQGYQAPPEPAPEVKPEPKPKPKRVATPRPVRQPQPAAAQQPARQAPWPDPPAQSAPQPAPAGAAAPSPWPDPPRPATFSR